MTTTVTDQEEELLIITDDDGEKEEIELTLEEDNSSSEDIISFDETIKPEEVEEIVLDDAPKLDLGSPETDEKDSELNLDFDLGGEKSELTVEQMLGDKEKSSEKIVKEDSQENDIFDFGLEEEESEDSIIETKPKTVTEDKTVEGNESSDISLDIDAASDEVIEEEIVASTGDDLSIGGDDGDDVNAILNATIAKLIVRKEKIESVKQETINSIQKLNNEIKSLQSEVKVHKTEVKEFDKEAKKIDENVENLEKMKMN